MSCAVKVSVCARHVAGGKEVATYDLPMLPFGGVYCAGYAGYRRSRC